MLQRSGPPNLCGSNLSEIISGGVGDGRVPGCRRTMATPGCAATPEGIYLRDRSSPRTSVSVLKHVIGHRDIGSGPERFARSHLRASSYIPALSALKFLLRANRRRMVIERILTQIRQGCMMMHADSLEFSDQGIRLESGLLLVFGRLLLDGPGQT
jgi:hypothetical protein